MRGIMLWRKLKDLESDVGPLERDDGVEAAPARAPPE
jgi:hypothetical protein